jgi:hypothetical protein
MAFPYFGGLRYQNCAVKAIFMPPSIGVDIDEYKYLSCGNDNSNGADYHTPAGSDNEYRCACGLVCATFYVCGA